MNKPCHVADREREQVLQGPRPGDHEKGEGETHRVAPPETPAPVLSSPRTEPISLARLLEALDLGHNPHRLRSASSMRFGRSSRVRCTCATARRSTRSSAVDATPELEDNFLFDLLMRADGTYDRQRSAGPAVDHRWRG